MSAEEVSHTPGPWHVTGCLDLWVESVGAPDDGTFHGIAHCGDIHWPDYETKQTEWEANARLIASAPTLATELAKLRDALERIDRAWEATSHLDMPSLLSPLYDAMNDAKTLLAKGRPG